MDVDQRRVQLQELDVGQRHHAEGFVDFEHSHVLLCQAALREDLAHSSHWGRGEVNRGQSCICITWGELQGELDRRREGR